MCRMIHKIIRFHQVDITGQNLPPIENGKSVPPILVRQAAVRKNWLVTAEELSSGYFIVFIFKKIIFF